MRSLLSRGDASGRSARRGFVKSRHGLGRQSAARRLQGRARADVSVSFAAVVVTAAMCAGSSFALAATPGVGWRLQVVSAPTVFESSEDARCEEHPTELPKCNHYSIVATNGGTRSSEGIVKIVDKLPEGVRVLGTPEGPTWTCQPVEEASREVVTCESEASVAPLSPAGELHIAISVPPATTLTNSVEISGGGDPTGMTVETESQVDAPRPSLSPLNFMSVLLNAQGMPVTIAGQSPGGIFTAFEFPSARSVAPVSTAPAQKPIENVKQIVIDLPPGLVGDAQATPRCSLTDATTVRAGHSLCPLDSRVGALALDEPGGVETELSIFNVTPEFGNAAQFAVYLPSLNHTQMLYATVVGSGRDTHVRVTSQPLDSLAYVIGVSSTFFGDPAAVDGGGDTPRPFLSSPSDCSASGFTSTIYVDSWQNPGRLETDGQPNLGDPNWKRANSTAQPVTGCENLQFHPTLTLEPEAAHRGADEPAGYESVLQIPQNEDPNGFATPPLKTTVVTLPAGVSISPAAAVGLAGCEPGPAGIGLERDTEANQPGHCPDASKIGQVEATTPVLEEPLKGSVYVAQPKCGGAGQAACTEAAAETGGVFAIYLELANNRSGVRVKVPGKVEVGGNGHDNGLQPDQVRTTFADTPQDPVGELKLRFNGGPGAALANPQTCGTQVTEAVLEPWSHAPAPGEAQGTADVTFKPAFSIGGCEDRFLPTFTAGSVSPQAAAYSPFTLTFARQDREQDLSGVTVNMPPGLIGKIAGIPQCPEVQANAGSCSSASQIGTATGGAGPGSQPLYQSGPVYLTGPYKGAPFGLSIVVPAVAGPFNLGNIVVRAAIFVNPTTTAITVVSDPLPQSIDGVPLRLKTVNVTVGSAGNFTFNPTNCTASSVAATLTGTGGASVPVASRFQAVNCGSLPFQPVLSASTGGKASKADGASLDVKVSYPTGPIGSYANIKSVKVDLPKQLPSRLTTLQKACLATVFAANPANCPAASDIGTATATTPVLNVPLQGPAYLVSHGGEAFPDLEIVLQGERITLVLDGNTNIKKGITSTTFKSVPDAPVSSFELKLPTGKDSILSANVPQSAKYNLCGQTLAMPTAITGQNGAVIKQTTRIGITGCAKAKALTRGQKLAAALKACHKRAKAKRAECERAARKRYGARKKKR
jgi:hypothetical protein